MLRLPGSPQNQPRTSQYAVTSSSAHDAEQTAYVGVILLFEAVVIGGITYGAWRIYKSVTR